MKIIKKELPPNHNLFLIGDDHQGTVLRHDRGWEQMTEMVMSKYQGLGPRANFVVDHGDVLEGITIDDPRYDGKTVKINIMRQIDDAVKNREKIKKRIIGIHDGNHPQKLWRFGDITKDICKRLNVPYATWSAKYNYIDKKGKPLYKHFAAHGFRSISSSADDVKRRITNMELSLKRILKFKSGDAVLMSMGHTHKILICRPVPELYLGDNGEDITQGYTSVEHTAKFIPPDHRWFVNTGSFYRLYYDGDGDGYAERFGYDPIEIGFPVVEVRDRKIVDIKKVILD